MDLIPWESREIWNIKYIAYSKLKYCVLKLYYYSCVGECIHVLGHNLKKKLTVDHVENIWISLLGYPDEECAPDLRKGRIKLFKL